MALPPAAPRKLSHTRTVTYRGYDREDGLWDIEAELTDVKTYTFEVPGERVFPQALPIHGLAIRLTIDDELRIHAITTSMDNTPHEECHKAPTHMDRLVGHQLGRGWRKAIDTHIGGTAGCTHLREMLFNMATAAYQTVPSGQWHRRQERGQPQPPLTAPPFHLGQCMTWALDSPAVARAYPMFYKPKATEPSSGDN